MGRSRQRRRRIESQARSRRTPSVLLLFLVIVFLVKLVALLQLQHLPRLEPEGGLDASAYVGLAQRVLGGEVALGPALYYLSPLYIYFLAAVLGLSGSFVAVRVIQIALGTAAVWCVFQTAAIWFGRRAAWIAAVLAALTGVFTFYEILILQASLDTFLTSVALYLLALGVTADTSQAPAASRAMLLTGMVFGLQTLNRPNVAVAAGGIVLTLLIVRRWRQAFWLVAGAAVAVTPVVARNVIVSRQLVLSSSHGGLNFYIGNNPQATGQYVSVPGVRSTVEGQSEDTRAVAEQAVGRQLSDAEVSRYFSGLALDWIEHNPAHAAKLFVRKLALVFNARHQWLDFSYPYYAYDTGSILRFLFVAPWLLVPLGLAGGTLLLEAPAGSTSSRLVWFSFVPFYAIGVAVFFVAERYRLPLFVPLCACAGGAVDALLAAGRRAPAAGPRAGFVGAAAIVAGVCGAVVTAYPFPLNDGRYDERLATSKVMMNRHDYRGAAEELQGAFERQPGNTVTEFNLGMALITAGRGGEGLSHLRHAVEAGVPIKGARYAYASATLATGDRDGAVTLLRTYYPGPDDDAESCLHVAGLALNAGAPRVAERYLLRAIQLRPGWPEATELLQRLRG